MAKKAAKKKPEMPPQAKIDLYDALIATNPKIERKGKTNPYTSHNGHMFTHLSKEGKMGIRLSDEDREKFMKKYKAKEYIQYGAKMRGYAEVPDSLLKKTKELKKYLDLSFTYIQTLEPK